MTPESRDRNLRRVRTLTGALAGVALAAFGLFAGLAASVTKHAYAASTKTTTVKTTTAQTTTAKTTTAEPTTTQTTTTQTTTPSVTPTPSAPVATSGGS